MDIAQKLKDLPLTSGVYIYRDSGDKILYVGKAKNLHSRVKQYFMPSVTDAKVKALVAKIADLEYIVTLNEKDAFSLENTLIKRHKPPYNIMLKDDKQYGYIKVSVKETFPRVIPCRKVVKDGYKYFGPFVHSCRKLIETIGECYPLISCSYDFSSKKIKPCLAYHIGTCPAPCVKKIDKEQYAQVVQKVLKLLAGNTVQAREILTEKMLKAAEGELFERAQEYKYMLSLLSAFEGGGVAALPKNVDYDVFSIVSDGKSAACNFLAVRKGKVLSSKNYIVNDGGLDEAQTLSSFILAFYQDFLPQKKVLVNCEIYDGEALSLYVEELTGVKCRFSKPLRGETKKLADMSESNAKDFLVKSRDEEARKYMMTLGAVEMLKEVFSLPRPPLRIECYDISNISGVDKVASQVVFTDGKPDKKQYRRFKIKTVEGADDFASMEEVLSRRLQRLLDKDELFGSKPDLIVVDGGKGQLSSAQKAFDTKRVYDIPLISLAKKEEIVYTLSGGEVRLPRGSYALKLLTAIRDEAHRYAVGYFRQLHNKNALKSLLSDIKGVGKKRQIELVRHFNNIERISQATAEEISQVKGMNLVTAQNIYKYFNG